MDGFIWMLLWFWMLFVMVVAFSKLDKIEKNQQKIIKEMKIFRVSP